MNRCLLAAVIIAAALGCQRAPPPAERPIAAGSYRVPMSQPLARLAFYLLEPRSNDGLATWNVFDEAIKKSNYPVVRTRN